LGSWDSAGKMPKIGALFVCSLIVALDVAAGICGIEAEVSENKVCIFLPHHR